MNRIVREDYPASALPNDLRVGLAADARVRVVVEVVESAACIPSLEELWAMRQPTTRSMDEIVAEIRQQRDEWDG